MTWSIPGYTADELVGFGATGEVWRGRDLASGERVALKRLRVDDPDGRSRLRREAALLTALDHPHLLRVRELVVADRECALVLDYAPAGSLDALLRRRGRLRPGEVVTALSPLAAALAYAHGEGVVHGDVTPANVLFTDEGRPLLADLGVARVIGDEPTVRATPEYADPAVARGVAPGPASDVFALAAVAFHALTGVPPWNAATPEDTFAVAALGALPDLRALAPETPEALAETLERALSLQPSARGGAAELALDLGHACTPEPVALGAASTSGSGARRAALTHVVHRPAPRGDQSTATGQHRRPKRRSFRPVHALVVAATAVARSRGLRAVVLGVGGLVLAVRLGIAWAGSDPPAIPPGGSDLASATQVAQSAAPTHAGRSAAATHAAGTTAPPAFTDRERRWVGVLGRLDARRAQAFAAADPAALAAVYGSDSPSLTADVTTVRRAAAARLTMVGVRHDVRALHVLHDDGDHAVLAVTETLSPHTVVRGGRQVAHSPTGPVRRYRMALAETHDGWRIESVTAA
jgi:hypothetical protein